MHVFFLNRVMTLLYLLDVIWISAATLGDSPRYDNPCFLHLSGCYLDLVLTCYYFGCQDELFSTRRIWREYDNVRNSALLKLLIHTPELFFLFGRVQEGQRERAARSLSFHFGQMTSTASGPAASSSAPFPPSKKKPERPFIFDQHPSRRIALRLAYHGHVHDGLAIQKETSNTVEGLLCEALKRLRLISAEGPQEMARCGRTDKGVSALSNCMSFIARASCRATDDPQLPPIDYCTKLNHILPSTIRAIGFAHVHDDFDARFSCKARTYRYYFCHRGLDLAAMQEAVGALVGTHNFRNFCVLDVVNVSNFERTVQTAAIRRSELQPDTVSFLELKANSFLYHQVRCTMEVLFLVGRHLEPPSIVRSLLERGDCKPQYGLADSTPLVLWECHFDERLQWQMTRQGFREVERQLQDIATALLLRATAASAMRDQLFTWYRDSLDCLTAASTAARSGETEEERYVVPRRRTEVTENPDSWSVVGCDWTQPRSDELRRSRQSSLLQDMKHRHAAAGRRLAQPTHGLTDPELEKDGCMAVVQAQRQKISGYVPLLERPVERTFDEQVQQLSGTKRARFKHRAQSNYPTGNRHLLEARSPRNTFYCHSLFVICYYYLTPVQLIIFHRFLYLCTDLLFHIVLYYLFSIESPFLLIIIARRHTAGAAGLYCIIPTAVPRRCSPLVGFSKPVHHAQSPVHLRKRPNTNYIYHTPSLHVPFDNGSVDSTHFAREGMRQQSPASSLLTVSSTGSETGAAPPPLDREDVVFVLLYTHTGTLVCLTWPKLNLVWAVKGLRPQGWQRVTESRHTSGDALRWLAGPPAPRILRLPSTRSVSATSSRSEKERTTAGDLWTAVSWWQGEERANTASATPPPSPAVDTIKLQSLSATSTRSGALPPLRETRELFAAFSLVDGVPTQFFPSASHLAVSAATPQASTDADVRRHLHRSAAAAVRLGVVLQVEEIQLLPSSFSEALRCGTHGTTVLRSCRLQRLCPVVVRDAEDARWSSASSLCDESEWSGRAPVGGGGHHLCPPPSGRRSAVPPRTPVPSLQQIAGSVNCGPFGIAMGAPPAAHGNDSDSSETSSAARLSIMDTEKQTAAAGERFWSLAQLGADAPGRDAIVQAFLLRFTSAGSGGNEEREGGTNSSSSSSSSPMSCCSRSSTDTGEEDFAVTFYPLEVSFPMESTPQAQRSVGRTQAPLVRPCVASFPSVRRSARTAALHQHHQSKPVHQRCWLYTPTEEPYKEGVQSTVLYMPLLLQQRRLGHSDGVENGAAHRHNAPRSTDLWRSSSHPHNLDTRGSSTWRQTVSQRSRTSTRGGCQHRQHTSRRADATSPSSRESSSAVVRPGVPCWGSTLYRHTVSSTSSTCPTPGEPAVAPQHPSHRYQDPASASRSSPGSLVLISRRSPQGIPFPLSFHSSPSVSSASMRPHPPQQAEYISFFEVNFEPLRLLGRGASGAALLVRHRMSGKFYAVKVLLVRDYESEKDVLQEVRVHSALDCKYLVQYHSSWSEVVTPQRSRELASIGLLPKKYAATTSAQCFRCRQRQLEEDSPSPLQGFSTARGWQERCGAGSPGIALNKGLHMPALASATASPDSTRSRSQLLQPDTDATVPTKAPRSRLCPHTWSFLLADDDADGVLLLGDESASSSASGPGSSEDSAWAIDSNSDSGSRRSASTSRSISTAGFLPSGVMDMRVVFIQMQLCQLTLAELLGVRKSIDRIENLVILLQLCSGLLYLHDRGILHRDVKPTNVFLDFSCRYTTHSSGTLSEEEDVRDEAGNGSGGLDDSLVGSEDGRSVHIRPRPPRPPSAQLAAAAFVGAGTFPHLSRSSSAVEVDRAARRGAEEDLHASTSDGLFCSSLACLPTYGCAGSPVASTIFSPASVSQHPLYSFSHLPPPWLFGRASTAPAAPPPLSCFSQESVSAMLRGMRAGPTEDTATFIRQRSDELLRRWRHRLRELDNTTAGISGSRSVHHHGSRLLAEWLLRHLVEVRLGDFGLAKLHTQQKPKFHHGGNLLSLSDANTHGVGSPLYASPEQLRGDVCTSASDIFSIGILMTEIYLLPSTVAERLDVLQRAREGSYPTPEVICQYPELSVIPLLTRQNPMTRMPVRALRTYLFGMLHRCLEDELDSYVRHAGTTCVHQMTNYSNAQHSGTLPSTLEVLENSDTVTPDIFE
eukprot:gene5901-4216_t